MKEDDPAYVKMLTQAKTEYEKAVRDAMERRNAVIRAAVNVAGMNKTRVGELVGLNRNSVHRIAKKSGGIEIAETT